MSSRSSASSWSVTTKDDHAGENVDANSRSDWGAGRYLRLGGVCGFVWLFLAASGFVDAALTPVEPITPLSMTQSVNLERAEIGKQLFYDVRLSRNSTQSCATCHPLDRGGMDGLPVARRQDGTPHTRNTPTIFNAGLNATLNWDGAVNTLEDHTDRLLTKLMNMTWPELLARLRRDSGVVSAFSRAYPDGMTEANVRHALVEFERSLVTPKSRFDRYLLGEGDVLTPREKDGYQLFKFHGCVTCHQGVNIGGNMHQKFGVFEDPVSGTSGVRDEGRFLITKTPRDQQVFRVPSLRNVAVTAPYFHDGRADSLDAAVETMGEAQLGRKLRAEEIGLIIDFLRTLTGQYRDQLLPGPQSEVEVR